MTLSQMVYGMTEALPKSEMYGLVSQMRRAAVSIPSNIAEGQARNSTGEFIQFLGIARGSLAELETQIELAFRLNWLAEATKLELIDNTDQIGRMLNGLITKLRSSSH